VQMKVDKGVSRHRHQGTRSRPLHQWEVGGNAGRKRRERRERQAVNAASRLKTQNAKLKTQNRAQRIGIFGICGRLLPPKAEVAKLADAPDLGSGGEILRGSSPLLGTSKGFAGDSAC
jgi:hypothetical protein